MAFSDPSSFGLIKFVMDEGQRIGEVAVLRPARYQVRAAGSFSRRVYMQLYSVLAQAAAR